MYKEKFNKDFKFGLKQEDLLFDTIKRLDSDLVKTGARAIFDYESEKTLVELKSRNNTYNKYPTTMVGYNKIQYANKLNKDTYFCFNFTDGLYYYKYNKNDKLDFGRGGRCDRGREEYKDYCYIPIEYLRKFE